MTPIKSSKREERMSMDMLLLGDEHGKILRLIGKPLFLDGGGSSGGAVLPPGEHYVYVSGEGLYSEYDDGVGNYYNLQPAMVSAEGGGMRIAQPSDLVEDGKGGMRLKGPEDYAPAVGSATENTPQSRTPAPSLLTRPDSGLVEGAGKQKQLRRRPGLPDNLENKSLLGE
jgi:hypothetical protein